MYVTKCYERKPEHNVMDFLHFTRYNVSNILILMTMHMNYMRAVARPQNSQDNQRV